MVKYCDSPLYVRLYSVSSWDLSEVLLVDLGLELASVSFLLPLTWGAGVIFHFEQQQPYQVIAGHFTCSLSLCLQYNLKGYILLLFYKEGC